MRFTAAISRLPRHDAPPMCRSRWLAFGLALLSGCSNGADPDAPNSMELNGTMYTVALKEGAAFVSVTEDEWSTYRRFGVRFPAGRVMASLDPAVEIEFDPKEIDAGDVIEFSEDWESIVHVVYRPPSGHRLSEAQHLVFVPKGGGGGTVRFDAFDPSPGGRIAGELVEATLYGYYDDVDDGEWLDPEEPMEMILRNFAFDCIVPDYD